MTQDASAPTKACSICGRQYPATTEFFYRGKSLYGLDSRCKNCLKQQRAAHYRAHRERWSEYARHWREGHREQMLEAGRRYRARHPGRQAENTRRYRERHPEKTIKSVVAYNLRRRREDPKARLSHVVSGAIAKALRERKGGHHWEDLVGYSAEDLMCHLESHFLPGMSWDNYGVHGWHIDHVKPVKAFLFASPADPDFKRCWALSNLQPMWARDNIQKSGRESALLLDDQARPRKRGAST